jgi:hypothetical protein
MLALGAASTAYADNAYWHGTRNSNWHHGVQGALSNWYAKPPFATENTPLPPPTGFAIFAPSARQHAVVVTRDVAIDEMLFTPGEFYPGAGQYGIGIARLATLQLKGRGLINQSASRRQFSSSTGGASDLGIRRAFVPATDYGRRS